MKSRNSFFGSFLEVCVSFGVGKEQKKKKRRKWKNKIMTGKRKPGMSLASDHCMHTIQNQSGYYHTEECSDAQFGQSYSQSHHHHPHHQHSSHHHHGENQKKVEQCANCGAIETKGTDQKQKEKEGGKEDEQKGVGGKDKGKKGDEVDCDEEGKENPQGENGAKTVVKLSICSNCYQGFLSSKFYLV